MNPKKIYTVIAIVFAVTYGYNLYWFFRTLIDAGDYGFQIGAFIRYIPVFAGIAGVVIFIASQFKRSNLLRIIMCLEIMSFPFLVFWYVQFFSQTYGPDNRPPDVNWTFYVGCVINLSLIICSITGLRMLSFNKTAKLNFIELGNERTGQFWPASAGLRFINRLVDAIVVAFIVLTNLQVFSSQLRRHFEFSTEIFIAIEIPVLLIYYIVLEGIFNTTAGKCATGTTIVNEYGVRPGFAKILGRTFCRLIPFEAFSFFGAEPRGWHDTMTNTYVVESINKEDVAMEDIILDAELNMR
ncbi:RDD family protein [Ferruginibacter sp. SUN106]|uniref:RDD family protein n=1 Tax=Ferruginibacter sp. SUN106 TaxID=2978348 RepID=UPI003D35B078